MRSFDTLVFFLLDSSYIAPSFRRQRYHPTPIINRIAPTVKAISGSELSVDETLSTELDSMIGFPAPDVVEAIASSISGVGGSGIVGALVGGATFGGLRLSPEAVLPDSCFAPTL